MTPRARRTGGPSGEPEAAGSERRVAVPSSTDPGPLPTAPGATVLRTVVKRDGRVVPFDPGKIEAAIAAAMVASGHEDATFAREVAGVVSLTLSQRGREPGAPPPGPPQIEEIQDLVERALMELGAPAVAKAYILYREKRARVREALRVHGAASARARAPRVREAEGVGPWSKGRIVAALMGEADLARAQAEEVASAVERRVLASGLGNVTTGLVRELVASELFERGWTRALRRQGAIGLGRADVEALLDGRPAAPWDAAPPRAGEGSARTRPPSGALAAELLRRFALEEVLPEDVLDLHLAGDLHVEDLGAPHLPLVLGVQSELFAAGEGAGDAFHLVGRVAGLAPSVSRGIVLEDPAGVLAPLARTTRPGSPVGLSAWLRALASVGGAARIAVDLALGDGRQSSVLPRLVEELLALDAEGGTSTPHLYLDGHALETLLAERPGLDDALEALLARGLLIPTWAEGEERCVGPGLLRRRGERTPLAVVGAVALNLPRLARRAGPWREEIVQSGLAELVRAALAAGRALHEFQVRHAGGRPGGLFARPALVLVAVGLREALAVLGDGSVDPELGARLLGLLADAAGRFAPSEPVRAVVAPFHGEAAARRFAWLDETRARAEGGRQPWLFAEATEQPRSRPYASGFGLGQAGLPAVLGASGRAEAELLRTQSAGALAFPAVVGGEDEEHPHLAAWRRFEVRRRASVGEVTLELFPPGARGRVLRPVR